MVTIKFQIPQQFDTYIVEGLVEDKNVGGQFGELWSVIVTRDPQYPGQYGYEGEHFAIPPAAVVG